MNITVICIGKLKESYWRDAVKEYSKRLGGYCSLDIVELKESRLAANPSPADELAVKVKEGEEILSHIRPSSWVVTLEIQGKKLSSEKLAEKIEDWSLEGRSDMTFPHQMMRVILLEQIYRSFKIIRHEPYHK